jgi:hypothetical protein
MQSLPLSTSSAINTANLSTTPTVPSYSAIVKQSISKPAATTAPKTEQPSSDTEVRRNKPQQQSNNKKSQNNNQSNSSYNQNGGHHHHHHNNRSKNGRRPSQSQLNKPFYHANSTPVITGHGSSDYSQKCSPNKAQFARLNNYNNGSNNFRKKQLN